jgi:hypothetical protein
MVQSYLKNFIVSAPFQVLFEQRSLFQPQPDAQNVSLEVQEDIPK